MLLPVKVKGQHAAIVGYGPGENGPMAIVVMNGALHAFRLSEVELQIDLLPKKLRKVSHRRKLKVVAQGEGA